MKTAPVKTNGSFSIIIPRECQKALQKGKLENKRVILTSSGADICTRSIGIEDFSKKNNLGRFLIHLNLTTVSSAAQIEGVYGEFYVR